MHARAASLAREFFDELRLPRVQHAPRRRDGGPGPRDPRATASRRPGSNAAFPLHAASRNRRRLVRNRIPAGSHLAAAV